MTDDDLRRWLTDDPIVLVVAATSLAIALSSCLYLTVRTATDNPLLAGLVSQQSSLAVAVPADDQRDRKSTRSKERRRRGKDPFRDLLKGGKKSKALLKAIKATDYDHSPPSADTLSNSSLLQNDSASSTSRSQSPESASDRLDMDLLGVQPDDGCARSTTPDGNTPSTFAADISDHDSLDAGCQTDDIRTHSLPPQAMTATETETDVISAPAVTGHASEDAPSSPPASIPCPDVRTPQPREAQAAYTGGSCAKLVRARTKLRLSRLDASVKSSLISSTPSPLPDSVASPLDSIQPCPALSAIPSTWVPVRSLAPHHDRSSSCSTDGAGPSTPTNSRGSTPPLRSEETERHTQPLDQCAEMQLASMRSALEAARLREAQLRVEAEQASRERDELRWGWNEDAGAWRRREAEVNPAFYLLPLKLTDVIAASAHTSPHAATSGVRGCRIVSGATGVV